MQIRTTYLYLQRLTRYIMQNREQKTPLANNHISVDCVCLLDTSSSPDRGQRRVRWGPWSPLHYNVLWRGHGVHPVSYTHLDVYKRQDTMSAGIALRGLLAKKSEAIRCSSWFSRKFSMRFSIPVSYTHLDVYKRQIWYSKYKCNICDRAQHTYPDICFYVK